MLRYAAISLGIGAIALAIVLLLHFAASIVVYVLKIVGGIALIAALVFFILDIVKRKVQTKGGSTKGE